MNPVIDPALPAAERRAESAEALLGAVERVQAIVEFELDAAQRQRAGLPRAGHLDLLTFAQADGLHSCSVLDPGHLSADRAPAPDEALA